MRFGLLTQWYDPEPGPAALPGVLARGLRQRGHDVQVLTGFPNYPTGKLAPGYRLLPRLDEQLDGVEVRRVFLYPDHGSSVIHRLANYGSFGMSASALGGRALRNLDAIWVNYSPITVAGPMWLARYLYKVPAVVHVLDLWPDTLLAAGFASEGRLYKAGSPLLQGWCNAMYRAASDVAYISPSVGSVLQERGVPAEKLNYVPMWADEHIFRPADRDLRSHLGLRDDEIVLLYAGALGEAQGLDSLIDACARVQDRRFVAVIAGSGLAEDSLRQRVDQLGLSNVRFIGRVAQPEMTDLLATADLCYVGLRPHRLSKITMPSKTQSCLAAGKPLLVAAEGDVASVADESGAGFVARPDDPDGIADAIAQAVRLGRQGLAQRGRQAHSYYQRTFSVQRGVDTIERLLTEAAMSTKVPA